jgi:two-component system, NarL family, nitrate/nitrite response regulator NarL
VSVVLCDDHEMFLDALAMVLRSRGHDVTAATQDPAVAMEIVAREHPDVLVLDVEFAEASGVDTAATVRQADSGTAILLLAAAAHDDVWSAFDDHLVDGVVNKLCSYETIDAAIRRVQAGDRVVEGWRRHRVPPSRSDRLLATLTDREREVLHFIVEGASTSVMATDLGVSENTIRTHVQNVLHKLGVHARGKAARVALDMGIVGHRNNLPTWGSGL